MSSFTVAGFRALPGALGWWVGGFLRLLRAGVGREGKLGQAIAEHARPPLPLLSWDPPLAGCWLTVPTVTPRPGQPEP